MACLPSRPGRGAETTLLCTGRPFRQWLQAGGGGTDNAASADAEFPGDVVSDVNVPCPALASIHRVNRGVSRRVNAKGAL